MVGINLFDILVRPEFEDTGFLYHPFNRGEICLSKTVKTGSTFVASHTNATRISATRGKKDSFKRGF
jgi:hypothetical protein